MSALQEAGTQVHEPMHRFRVEVPADTLGPVLPAVAAPRGLPDASVVERSTAAIEGLLPVARVLESDFDSYQPVRGAIPTRPRTDHNPLNREEYMLHVARRVAGVC
jgi:ribosomal protection tetracycline resistance protein